MRHSLNVQQIKLVQTAARGAGLRFAKDDSRYRMVLRQYKQPNGKPVESCKQMSRSQVDDFLRLCESMGWENKQQQAKQSYRDQCSRHGSGASDAQIEAIMLLAQDLGYTPDQFPDMVSGFTHGRAGSLAELDGALASSLIEALKDKFGRMTGKYYYDLDEVAANVGGTDATERSATDGTEHEEEVPF